jgi:hypothetical protein
MVGGLDEKKKRGYFGKMKRSLFIIGLLLIAVAVFEFHPAVKYWRVVVPEDVYVGKTCDCDCIMESRPWYSRLNYWFWLWIIATPVIVFSVKPATPRWQRTIRTVVAIGFCYGIMNLALHLMWDIRNGPFSVYSDYPWQKSWDDPGTKCANIADGASIIFTAFFGWIYAIIYTGWCEILWYRYHKRRTKLLTDDFKRDWISRIVVWISAIITTIIILAVISLVVALVFEKFS